MDSMVSTQTTCTDQHPGSAPQSVLDGAIILQGHQHSTVQLDVVHGHGGCELPMAGARPRRHLVLPVPIHVVRLP
jgi:hypothetical protein